MSKVFGKALLALFFTAPVWADTFEIAQTPIFVNNSAPPLNMLVMGKDHKLYYEAYNDASDLDGDGVIDIGYKPGKIEYYGSFESHLCYGYTSEDSGQDKAGRTGLFVPKKLADSKTKACGGGYWSGDFLNYLTTSRMDALRKVLYGGKRAVDEVGRTVITGAYIPQDAHSWGKEYTSKEVDGYEISDYSPYTNPLNGTRHLFAVVTRANTYPTPTLSVRENDSERIWDWVSKNAPVSGIEEKTYEECIKWNIFGKCSKVKKTTVDVPSSNNIYKVKVEVCSANDPQLLGSNCTAYGKHHKPTGILHDFGQDDKMYFGLITGSYDNNLIAGNLRKNIESFRDEVNPATGQFNPNTKGIVHNINALQVARFNLNKPENAYQSYCGLIVDNPLDKVANQRCYNWGNPIAEMMYEGIRYFSNYSPRNTQVTEVDKELGLTSVEWVPPNAERLITGGYGTKGNHYPVCAKPVMTVISDINPSYDYKLPGSYWGYPEDMMTDFNAQVYTDKIGEQEGLHGTSAFIGQSGSNNDNAPSAKTINKLSQIKGLAPEEPSKSGTYYSAGVAKFGAEEGVWSDSKTNNKVMTYAVALASPLPKIEMNTQAGTVMVIPFGKSVAHYGVQTSGSFQPTLSIVDYYVEQIANMDPQGADRNMGINGGEPYIKFRINYEDVEQGNDHDMDAIVTYEVLYEKKTNSVKVNLNREYDGAGIVMHIGYVISGVQDSGVYLDITSKPGSSDVNYKLDTPSGKKPGDCAVRPSSCAKLQSYSQRSFKVSSAGTATAQILPSPLWYAAKHGMPGRDPKTVKGDPDNYFLVTNASKLKDQLTRAFADITQRNRSITRPALGKAPANNSLVLERSVYRTDFDVQDWSGKLIKETLNLENNKLEQKWEASIDPSSRKVWFNDTKKTKKLKRLSTWADLNGYDDFKRSLNSDDNKGDKRLEYLLGKHIDGFRYRKTLLGDIVNSSPVLVEGAQYSAQLAAKLGDGRDKYPAFIADQAKKVEQKKGMIYVGANDGMLHGFSAKDGVEKFAFIPTPVFENLYLLSDPDYGQTENVEHRYFVDGELTVADAYLGSKGWRTVLVGGLGGGGAGVFALDVTDPDDIKLLWEFTKEHSDNLGYTFGQPVITRLNNGQWVALINNGYKSRYGEAALFVIDLASGKLLQEFIVQGGANNGLSAIKLADYNNDGIPDFAYAGDLQGNLWRFDLDFSANRKGAVSYGGLPLFSAIDEQGKAQPITTPPSIVRHPTSQGYLIMFGTGRYLSLSDKLPSYKNGYSIQSVYGIWDKHVFKGKPGFDTDLEITKASLHKQHFELQTEAKIGDEEQSVDYEIRTMTNNSPFWKDHNGWYFDLKSPNSKSGYPDGYSDGERVVDQLLVRGDVLFVSTRTPNDDVCESGITGWNYVIDTKTGGRTAHHVLDFNQNMKIGNEDGYKGGNNSIIAISGYRSPPGGFVLGSDRHIGSDGLPINVVLGGLNNGRQNWYVLPRNVAEPAKSAADSAP